MNKYAVYSDNAMYLFKLTSDQELKAKAVTIFDQTHLKNNELTLDSAIFGSTPNSECAICHSVSWNCPGHYALIELPFPIPKYICLDDWKKVICCICPMCSHIPINDVGYLLHLPARDRLTACKKAIDRELKRNKNNTMTCMHCGNKIVPYAIDKLDELSVTSANSELTGFVGRINPNYVYNMLQSFVECDELGFCETYHPKNFMTNYIVIVSTKLRPKSTKNSEATLTSCYKTIIDEIIPEANTASMLVGPTTPIIDSSGGKLVTYNKVYNKLYAYYKVITAPLGEDEKGRLLQLMNKRDKKHYDPHNALIGRFKGKDKSIFGQGIVYSRVNKSARTVLGGAVDVPFRNLCIPYHICQQLSTDYKVYEENIDRVRSLILAMQTKDIANSETLPKILQIVKHDATGRVNSIKITPDNANLAVMKLTPGDEVVMSLNDTDFTLMSRFPIVREESISAYEVKADSNSIITIPLPTCAMKVADFDGDEAQAYCGSSHNTDAESILTASTYAQFMAYKDGNPAIWYSADAPIGIGLMKQGDTIAIHDGELMLESKEIISIVESYLPKDLCYCDKKTEIINGKFKNGKTSMNNKELHKYIYQLYGPDVVADLMHNVTTLAYDLCKDQGVTLGFELKLYGDAKIKEEIQKVKDETYQKMCEIELTNDPLKDFKIMQLTELQKPKLLKIVIDAGKGSNIDRIGFLTSRQVEYYQSVVQINHITVDGTRVQPTLADGTRTTCAGPRYSINPHDYGFEMNSYDSDITPLSHFFECKEQRLAIFNKGASVAKNGYLTKKLTVAYSKVYTDFNGAIVDNFRILAPQYGACGLNPRLYVEQPLTDMLLDSKTFNKNYSDKRLQYLHDDFNAIYDKYRRMTNTYRAPCIKEMFAAGFNFENYINMHKLNDKATAQKDIDAFIEKLFNVYCTPANKHLVENNFRQHEYYFRQKLTTCQLSNEVQDKIVELFSWTLLDGGDAVGGKAALACSEPLTQDTLHSIHHASGGMSSQAKVFRVGGTTRFEELMTKPKKKEYPSVITIKLYDDSKESCERFVCRNETIIFNNLWYESYICMTSGIPDIITKLHPNIDFSGTKISNYYMVMTINLAAVANFNVSIADIIYVFTTKIPIFEFITGYATNDKGFMMYMFFKESVGYDKIAELSVRLTQSKPFIIHGSCIQNSCVIENVNRPGHYVIECNEIVNTDAFNTIVHLPEVDPTGCLNNNMRECAPALGICETSARHYEELVYTAINLSATTGILQRHYKVIADAIYSNGEAIYADRNSFKYDRYSDTLRYVQFETAKDMLRNSIKNGDINPVGDPFSAIIFNEDPTLGTGASKIHLYQTD